MYIQTIKDEMSRNAQNDHILGVIKSAGECINTLVSNGYTVLKVEIKDTRPVVWIQACSHCEKLLGAWYRIEGGPQGRRYTWQAPLLGCRVQWQTTEV